MKTFHDDPFSSEEEPQVLSQNPDMAVATWERHDARANGWVRTDPPARHVTVVYDSTGYRHLPVLNGLARQPYLRPDGTLATVAGYDSATCMFGVFDTKQFSIPDNPTREDAESSLKILADLLDEFSFANPSDRAAAISGMLTATIRPSLPLAPMYHVKAPIIGSGKSFLCRILGAFATQQYGAATSFPKDDEECRKILLAELLKSPAVIEFDNLTSDLIPHKSLCAAITSEFYNGRILGVSKTATVSTRTLLLSSGNNVDPVGDMTRRCITINLDPMCEIPAARTFKNPDLLTNLYRERGRYVSAALTIIRAWIVAGRQKRECRALASFGDWSDLCRQSLLWLGEPDPAESLFLALMEDPDRDILGQLLKYWYLRFGSTPKMIRDVVSDAMDLNNDSQELRAILEDIAGERDGINRLRLGWWIKRHANRPVDGLRFVSAGGSRSAQAWKVVSVS